MPKIIMQRDISLSRDFAKNNIYVIFFKQEYIRSSIENE